MTKNETLSAFGFLATVLVVMCHVDNFMAPERQTFLVRYFGDWFTAANTANFFVLSGYFLGCRFGEDGWYGKALLKRLRTLLVPYVLWSLIYLAICVLIVGLKNHDWVLPTFKEPFFGIASIFGIGWNKQSFDFPLWYIKTLFYFIIVSAPFFYLIKRSVWWLYGFVVGCLVAYFAFPQQADAIRYCFPLVQFGAFLVGAAFALRGWSVHIPKKAVFGAVALAVWSVLSWLAMSFDGCLGRVLGVVNVVGSMACLYVVVSSLSVRVPQWASRSSFFVYAAHWIFLILLSRLPCPAISAFCVYSLRLTIALVVLIGLSRLLDRFMPRLNSLLCGGRG